MLNSPAGLLIAGEPELVRFGVRAAALRREAELARIIDACATGPGIVAVSGIPGTGRSRLLHEVAAHFDTSGDRNWNVVLVDDIELLDDDAVLDLAASVRDRAATVVVTAGVAIDHASLAPLLQSGNTVRVHIDPLGLDDCRAIAADMAGESVAEDDLEAAVTAAAGDLALLAALVTDLVEGRDLGHSPLVAEIISRRARLLGGDAPHALELIALLEPVPMGVVPQLGSGELDRLERYGLVTLAHDDHGWTASISLPVAAEAIRRGLTVSRRVGLLSDFAAGLDPDVEWPEVAEHRAKQAFDDAGLEVPPAIRSALAQAAFAAFDYEAASALAVPAASTHWRAAFVLGWVARTQRDLPAALAWFESAASMASSPVAVTRVALSVAGLQAWQLLDVDAARQTVQTAIDRIGTVDGAWELRCEIAFLDTFLGKFDSAAQTCREVLAERGLDTLTTWNASLCLAYAQVTRADTTDLASVLLRSRDLIAAVVAEHPDSRDLHTALSVGSSMLDGDIRRANALAFELFEHATDDEHREGMTASIAFESLLLAGDPRVAAVAAAGVDQLTQWDALGALPATQAALALGRACTDELAAAAELLDRWDGPTNDHRARTLLARAAVRLADAGDADAAVLDLVRVSVEAADAGYTTAALLALGDALWWPEAAATKVATNALAAVAADTLSPLGAMFQRLAQAALEESAPDLELAAEEFWEAGAAALAALALRLAAAAAGENLAARRAEARAHAIASISAPVTFPATTKTVPGGVTRREMDIAVRAAAGTPSRTIATETFLSTRTVDNHLRSVYEKLDLSGRDQLAEMLWQPAANNG